MSDTNVGVSHRTQNDGAKSGSNRVITAQNIFAMARR